MSDQDRPTSEMTCTNTHGGPCPVCGKSGELLSHSADHGPGGQRLIRHLDDDNGELHECTILTADGVLFTSNGRWTYRSMSWFITNIVGGGLPGRAD
jgi:hypothetical protein